MPVRIETANIARIDTERIDINDAFPGTYGFDVVLDRNPGPEWAVEFNGVYDTAARPGKPPVLIEGDTITVYFLPLYENELLAYLRFLHQVVAETNRSVELRNSVLPDEEGEKAAFRERLRAAVREFESHTRKSGNATN